jgi:hypothetical protein
MTDQPTEPTAASGNRWEPTAPPPAYPPPPAPVATAEPRRLPRPGPPFWWAGAAAATIVLVASAGFLVGRASVDDGGDRPVQIQRQFPGGGGPQLGYPPGGVPQPQE